MLVDGVKTNIIGVMRPDFRFSDDRAEYLAPLPISHFQLRGSGRFLMVAGRLKPGVSIEQAQADMEPIARQLAKEFPRDMDQGKPWTIRVQPVREALFGFMSRPLLLLQGAVAFVLLIACANVAALLLARASSRQTEVAIRAALGAGRGRIFRQFITESVMLSLLGGVLGVLLAWWGVRVAGRDGAAVVSALERDLDRRPRAPVQRRHFAADGNRLRIGAGTARIEVQLRRIAEGCHPRRNFGRRAPSHARGAGERTTCPRAGAADWLRAADPQLSQDARRRSGLRSHGPPDLRVPLSRLAIRQDDVDVSRRAAVGDQSVPGGYPRSAFSSACKACRVCNRRPRRYLAPMTFAPDTPFEIEGRPTQARTRRARSTIR